MSARAEVPDADLRYLILGAFAAVTYMDAFPIKVRQLEEVLDDNGVRDAFIIVTESGLRFKIGVEFEEVLP